MTTRPLSFSVVILGAGPAGLSAAIQARRAGHSVAVIEKSSLPGGMSQSLNIAGQNVDLGSHRLHYAMRPEVMEFLQTIPELELQVRKRHGRIRLFERWLGYPLSLVDMCRTLPLQVFFKLLLEQAMRLGRSRAGDSFSDRIRSSFGETLFKYFYQPYSWKLWGTSPDDLSAEVAEQRVSALSLRSRLQRLIPLLNSRWKRFLYPTGGYGQICSSIAAEADRLGVEFFYDHSVSAVEPISGGACRIVTDGTTFETQNLWSTIPASQLAVLFSVNVPAEVLSASDRLQHRAMVLLYLVLRDQQYTEFDAHYLPGEGTIASRISEPKNYSESHLLNQRTVLCVEIPCWEGDSTWLATDQVLSEQIITEMASNGFPALSPDEIQTVRLPKVYPVMPKGYENDLGKLAKWIEQYNWLLVFGRQGLFVPDNLHHAIYMGLQAVESLDDNGKINHEFWQESLETFSTHVVED